MSERSFHVLIIGGGLGGLCLAQGLKKAGVGVAVYERDRTRTDRLQGYRIHIDPDGGRALHECLPPALFEAFAATCGKPGRRVSMLTERLEELLRIDLTRAAAYTDPVAAHRSVSRITLRQVLLEGLGDVVYFDKRFVRYEEAPDGRVVAHFGDGTTAVGDVLVAADGGNSPVRQQFLPHARRVETGVVGIAGKVPLTEQNRDWIPPLLIGGPTIVSTAEGRAMFIASMEHRRGGPAPHASLADIGGDDAASESYPGLLFDNQADYLFWAFSARREKYPPGTPLGAGEADGPTLRDVVLGMTEGWHPTFHWLVRAADPSTIMTVNVRTSTAVDPWPTRNITLLGDAIHSMTPYRGIGANTALRDAALLARNLAAASRGETPLLEAIGSYESEMIAYGFEAVRESLRAMERGHSSQSRIGRALTRVILRVVNALPPLKRRMILGRRPRTHPPHRGRRAVSPAAAVGRHTGKVTPAPSGAGS